MNSKDDCRKSDDLTVMENSFELRNNADPLAKADVATHAYGAKRHVCSTDARGYKTRRDRDPTELVLDATEGFIPLWAKGVNLRWRFNDASMNYFQDPVAAKNALRKLFAQAVLQWGDAVPVTFTERNDAWDFEILMKQNDDCNASGCVLASAFFPDSGRHRLNIYPKMLHQEHDEMIETLVHEIGHIFGLRHFFANVSEQAWPSEIFGTHDKFTIMNYGHESMLTEVDIRDLKLLYEQVWSGELTNVNGTKIVMVTPFHELAN